MKIIIPSLENCDYSWVEILLFYYMEILQYSCINQVIIMKTSILQYEANPVYEFVTMKTGNHQDPCLDQCKKLTTSLTLKPLKKDSVSVNLCEIR